MKSLSLASLAGTLLVLSQAVSAHFIWNSLLVGDTTSTAAIRMPVDNSPVSDVTSLDIRCNVNPGAATETINVPAGSKVGFGNTNAVCRRGPAAIYLGKAPGNASSWDGSGANWFKIDEWGAAYKPFRFIDFNLRQLTTTIPTATPSGQYLLRIEQIGLHDVGSPEWFISCAQINITGGGTGNPSKVSIPGYISPSDPGLMFNIYDPVPTAYRVPGPAPWRG